MSSEHLLLLTDTFKCDFTKRGYLCLWRDRSSVNTLIRFIYGQIMYSGICSHSKWNQFSQISQNIAFTSAVCVQEGQKNESELFTRLNRKSWFRFWVSAWIVTLEVCWLSLLGWISKAGMLCFFLRLFGGITVYDSQTLLNTLKCKKISNDQELIQSDPTSCPQN